MIAGDGDVVAGAALVNESAVTGESAPVIRESGGDRSAVTGGTTVIANAIIVRITANPGETFLDRMIGLIEGAKRRKTPNEVALEVLLIALTLVFLLVCANISPLSIYSVKAAGQGTPVSLTILVALFVCLAPTTIAALLPAIGIAGMDRLFQKNVIALSGRAIEAAGDVNVLLLDKTGTITHGNREAVAFVPVGGHSEQELAEAALMASLTDETPEGRSVVVSGETEVRPEQGDANRCRGRGVQCRHAPLRHQSGRHQLPQGGLRRDDRFCQKTRLHKLSPLILPLWSTGLPGPGPRRWWSARIARSSG